MLLRKKLKCGISQIPTVGPLWFLIYTNDMPHSLKPILAIQFADHSTIYKTHKDLRELFPRLNSYVILPGESYKANTFLRFIKENKITQAGYTGFQLAILEFADKGTTACLISDQRRTNDSLILNLLRGMLSCGLWFVCTARQLMQLYETLAWVELRHLQLRLYRNQFL